MSSGKTSRRTYRKERRQERKILGALLKLCRTRMRLTQEQLAGKLGKEHSYISRLESGEQHLDVLGLLDLLRETKTEPSEFMTLFVTRCKALETAEEEILHPFRV